MMSDVFQVVWLSLVQGFTEFLPISSSAHLILVPRLLGWPEQGLAFDVVVHLGTLMAVLVYFQADLKHMGKDWILELKGHPPTPYSRLVWGLGLGTIPVGLVGLFGKSIVEMYLRSSVAIALSTVIFASLLGFAAWRGVADRSERQVGWKDMLMIGGAQALALIPGASRSGVTMTAGLWVGLTPEAAARYSFLLSIPVISLAGGFEVLELFRKGVEVQWSFLILGFSIAAVSAYVCIHVFLNLLNRIGMFPFVIYRIFLAGVIFAWLC